MGYHFAEIRQGVYGEVSKIAEEFQELEDAIFQKNKIMELIELSDILGAIEGYLENKHPGYTLKDLITMSEATKRAFSDGSRVPKNC